MQQQRSFSNPSQYSWNSALKDIQSAQKMDEVFGKVRAAIEQHSELLKRDAAVRLKLWLAKLSEQTNNPVWKKNRNAYAKLLLNQLKQGCLEKPFIAAPPAGPLQTLPTSLTYTHSLPRTSSARSSVRSGTSVASSQGRPSSNAAEAPQLDDYIGRHASPRRTASAQATIPLEEQNSQAQERESTQLSRPQSGLWGVESNPSRQPSTSARAKSPPRQQNSQTDSLGSGSSPVRQRSGILRTGSSGSSLKRHESHAAPERKSLTRGPSRLRDSSTDAEGYYAAAGRDQCASGESSSEEDGRQSVPLTPGRKAKHLARQSSTEEEDERKHQRHSPRGSRQRLPCNKNKHGSSGLCHHCQHPCSSQKRGAGGAGLQPQHQHHHTAEKYMSRARVREALSPRQRPPHSHSYAAKARILDLHDNCTLAEQEQVELKGSDSPRLHSARDCRQGGAQIQLGGTSMGLPRGLAGGRRGDGIDLADESWQPSKLELQARLGASKERQLELEWRLQQAEQKIAQAQAQQVAQQLAGSQQTQQAATSGPTSAPRKDRLKRDLSRLIDKYEKQQTRWGSPRRAASMQHLLPPDHRSGSWEDRDLDGLAEITAALTSCSQGAPTDVSSGDHPLSREVQNPELQSQTLPPQHSRSSLSLSSSNSSHSVASGTQEHWHRQTSGSAPGGNASLQPSAQLSDGEESRFMKKLQDFQRGTDLLRQQISLG